MSDTEAQIKRLQKSVSEVQQLRSSAAVSIGMMALGVAVLVGGIAYTVARIAPLENRAARLRTEIEQMENYALARRVESARSADSAQAARAALAATQRQLDSINATLRRLAGSGALSPATRSEVTSALESGQRAELTVAAAEQQLPDAAQEGPPSQVRESMNVLIERLFDESSVVRLRAYDDLMAQHARSPELIPALLRYANAHTDNLNGIYNALVVLNTVPSGQLRGRTQEVTAFLDRAEGLGPRIQARAQDVRNRLPLRRTAGG